MQHFIVAIVVAVAYVALACVSKAVSLRRPGDAWTVWLASGVVLRLPRSRRARSRWIARARRAASSAPRCFALDARRRPARRARLWRDRGGDRGRRGAHRVAAVPAAAARSTRARELAAIIVGRRAAACARGRRPRDGVARRRGGGTAAGRRFACGSISNFIGTLLVAPVIVAWAQLPPAALRRHDDACVRGGAVACALFLGTM